MEEGNHTITRKLIKRGHPRRVIQQYPNEDGGVVGEEIRVVIEAKHEAGYLVSAKLGNSDQMLRGVLFKSGRSHPITVDNDVAPHLPMLRGNPSRSQPLPVVRNYVPVIGRNNSNVMRHHSNRGRAVRALARRNSIQPTHPLITANHLVPVVLQPSVHLQNGGGRVSVSVPRTPESMQTETGSQAKPPSTDEVIHLD